MQAINDLTVDFSVQDLPDVKSIKPVGVAMKLELWALFLGIVLSKQYKRWIRVVRSINACVYLWPNEHKERVNGDRLKQEIKASEQIVTREKTQALTGLDKARFLAELELHLEDELQKKPTIPDVLHWLQQIDWANEDTRNALANTQTVGMNPP